MNAAYVFPISADTPEIYAWGLSKYYKKSKKMMLGGEETKQIPYACKICYYTRNRLFLNVLMAGPGFKYHLKEWHNVSAIMFNLFSV